MEVEEKAILVVDDDEVTLESVKELLQSEGYRVETAQNGREALEKSQGMSHNLLLLAFELVEKEGTEFQIRMRKCVSRRRTIIIADDTTVKKANGSANPGPEGYVAKPVDPENLLKVVGEKLKEQEEINLFRSVIPWAES